MYLFFWVFKLGPKYLLISVSAKGCRTPLRILYSHCTQGKNPTNFKMFFMSIRKTSQKPWAVIRGSVCFPVFLHPGRDCNRGVMHPAGRAAWRHLGGRSQTETVCKHEDTLAHLKLVSFFLGGRRHGGLLPGFQLMQLQLSFRRVAQLIDDAHHKDAFKHPKHWEFSDATTCRVKGEDHVAAGECHLACRNGK